MYRNSINITCPLLNLQIVLLLGYLLVS
uniref:Uncharacterized protein n=1 Tax=Anguilla anguilla TaxID=7936 RepID=A0A0E9S4G9_ANGAN